MKTFKFLKLPEATFLQNGSSPVLSSRKIWTSPVENIFNVDHVTLSLLAQGIGWSQKQDCTGNKHIWGWCYTFCDSPIDRKLSTITPVIPFFVPILAHWEANPWVWYANTATTQNVYFLFKGDGIKVGLNAMDHSFYGGTNLQLIQICFEQIQQGRGGLVVGNEANANPKTFSRKLLSLPKLPMLQ